MRKVKSSIVSTISVVSLVVILVACGGKKGSSSASKDELSGNISLSGAFALYPLAVQNAEEFKQLHPNVKIDISAGGAGKGITDALAGVVDIGMVSRELAPEEIQKGAVPFAIAKDAVVATASAGNPNVKVLLSHGITREAAIGVWITGKVKTWGQILGNSNTAPVTAYTRSDACGAADTWAKWLGKKQEDLKGTAVFGDPGVIHAIQKDVNGIGMNNIGFAYNPKTLKPNSGIVIVPIDINNNGKIDADENFYTDQKQQAKAIAQGKYPSPPARNLYLVTKGKPTNPVVKAFLEYILTKGEKNIEKQGYIQIDQAKIDEQLKLLK